MRSKLGGVVTTLAAWQTFYLIVGSAAGALTGLQFVVMALVADVPITRDTARTADAFATPTIVHFGAALLLSAILSAPWGGMGAPALLCGLCGVIGFVYAIVVAQRLRKQTEYQPVFADWFFHVLLPSWRTGSWLRRHTQLAHTRAKPFSASQLPRCFAFHRHS